MRTSYLAAPLPDRENEVMAIMALLTCRRGCVKFGLPVSKEKEAFARKSAILQWSMYAAAAAAASRRRRIFVRASWIEAMEVSPDHNLGPYLAKVLIFCSGGNSENYISQHVNSWNVAGWKSSLPINC